jgi:hypothetical protein
MSVDGPAVPEDPTGYRKQAIRLADERDFWKALAKSWGDEKDRLTADHRAVVEALERVHDLLADPDGADVLEALAVVERILPDDGCGAR